MGDARVSPGHLITRRDVLRAGAIGLGTMGLVTSESLAGLLTGTASAATVGSPRWGPAGLVATVPLEGAVGMRLAVADFNGDGHQDVLVVRGSADAEHTYPVTVLVGDGKGKFTDGTSSVFEGDVPQTQVPRQIVIADFNGDGRPDVFIADTGGDQAPFPGYQNTLILSAPGGKLVDATANLPQQYAYTHSAAAADIDGNGTIDIYQGTLFGAAGPRILLNDGTGHFTVGTGLLPVAQTDTNQNQYTGSTFADVNGDGHTDLVLAGNTESQSVVLLNDGTGHFTLLPNALPAKPFGPDAIGLGPISFDINGDGHPDLLIGFTQQNPFYVGRSIQVLINNGDGTFSDQTATSLPQGATATSGGWPEFFRVADLQRTGNLDFGAETFNMGDDVPHIYLRDQNGNFVPGPAIATAFSEWAFIDATGDGSNDIIGVTGNGALWLIPEIRANTLAPPVVSHLKLTPATFRAAHQGPSISRAAGTFISYTVTEAGTTTFTVERETMSVSGARKFTRHHGSFSHHDTAGRNHFRFSGRVGGRTLSPGRYRLNVAPKSATGHVGKTQRAEFRIIN